MIWLVERGKIIVLHVWHAFLCNFWRSSDDVKFAFLRFWQQRKPAAVNLLILCLCMKTIRAKQAKVDFAYFLQSYQHRINAKRLKPGFHIVVSVVSVVRKKFIGQIRLYGNLPYKCSIQQKREIQLVVRDRMNSICPMNFFRTTDTTDTTNTLIWKPGLTQRKVPF